MKVVLVGGSGWMGSAILAELMTRDVEVTAVVRRADALADVDVPRATADAYDTDALTTAFAGADIVVSAFNPGWQADDLYDSYLAGARSIQAAVTAAGVPRLLVVGGASSLLDDDGRQLIDSVEIPEPYASGVRAARDYLEMLRPETGIDWVFLSPPMNCGPVGPTERRGTYRVGSDHPVVDAEGHSSISGPDLAMAVADEVEQPQHHRQRFTVGY